MTRHFDLTPTLLAITVGLMPVKLGSADDIRKERQKLGLTLEETAHLLGVAVASLSRWERGVVEPSRLVLRGIQGMFEDYRKAKERRR
jgi:predicted transcriptional regulator